MTTTLQPQDHTPPAPEGYVLTKIFPYENTFVEIYTNGSHYVFAHGGTDSQLGRYYITVSAPARIGNAP